MKNNIKDKLCEKKHSSISMIVVSALSVVLALAIAMPLTAHFARENDLAVQTAQTAQTEQTEVIDDAVPQVDLSVPWYERYSIITHALGSVEGRIHTNSKEAFIESYEKGSRIFEADFSLTSDGELVVRHDFTGTSYYNLEQVNIGHMTYEQYMDSTICYGFTPLDAKGLFDLMKAYPDAYLVTDTKMDDEEGAKQTFEKFCEAMEETGDDTLRDRIIIQIYNYDMYEWVKDIVPEQNYIFTLYMLRDKNFDKIGSFCKENNIPVVTMNYSILTKATVDKLHGYGLEVYAHTLNRLRDMATRYIDTGVDGWYSDYVTDDQYALAVSVEVALAEQKAEETNEN